MTEALSARGIKTTGWITLFSIDILAMPNFDDFYQNDLIMNFVDDAVTANTNPIGQITA